MDGRRNSLIQNLSPGSFPKGESRGSKLPVYFIFAVNISDHLFIKFLIFETL